MKTTGGANRGTRTRRARALRGVVTTGSGLLLIAFGLVGSASADPCPLTDPLCVIETVDDTVDQTADTVKDHANATVDTVRNTVKDLTDPGTDGPGGGGGGNDGRDGGNEHGSKPGDPGSRSTQPTAGATAGSGGPSLVLTTVSGTTPVAQPREKVLPVLTQDLPAALREAAVGLALPLLIVVGIVIGFTTIQNRLDRGDPKLALAPLAVDVLRFE